MADTIRERIIQSIAARLAVISVANGYNTGMGTNVLRARRNPGPHELPCAVVWPQPETAQRRVGGRVTLSMPVRVEGIAAYGVSTPSVVAEKIMGDLVLCLTSHVSAAISAFASGGTGLVTVTSAGHGLSAGDEVRISGTVSYNGVYTVSAPTEDTFKIAATFVATGTGVWTAIANVTEGLADDIAYESGGTDDYPNEEEGTVGASAVFAVTYKVLIGNPYSQ